ncbi:MAG TPA: dual specificity protein phosphatase [Propionicimonas sp.]|nr:dual specificity protein phosphatase [Propionicimonas sp.]
MVDPESGQPAGSRQGLVVANAAFVTERVAVGGDLSPNFGLARRQLDELVAAGITHIADLREEWSDETLVKTWAPQVRYLHHRVADAGQAIGGAWFDELADWVDAALAEPGSKVLVHCHMGVNRAPSAVLALLLHGGMGLRPALDAIRSARPVAVIDYARSALDWQLERTAADARVRRNARRALDRWRRSNHLDAGAVIRAIRDTEHPGNRWFVRLGPADPDALADVLESDGNVAVGLAVDLDPDVLGQLDEVLFLTGAGLVGRALVVGPTQSAEPHSLLLPVLVTDLFPPVPVQLDAEVEQWLAQAGPNPKLLSPGAFQRLTEPRDPAR